MAELTGLVPELQAELDRLREESLAGLPPEALAAFQEASVALARSGIAERALRVGEQAPDFALPNVVGRELRLADLRQRGPVVITFYRGAW